MQTILKKKCILFFKTTSVSLDYTLIKITSWENVLGFHEVNSYTKQSADRTSVNHAMG